MKRLLDAIAPVRPPGSDRGYRRVLRWAALPVVDRRWAASLCALALGFGIFVGVAIGPGTSGTLATGAPQVIELPAPLASGDGGGGEEVEASGAGGEAFGGGGEEEASSEAFGGVEEEEASFSQLGAGFEEEPLESGEETTAPAHEPTPPATDEKGASEEEEEAEPVSGVVVHLNPAAGSYTIATAGSMETVHAAKLPPLGARLTVPAKILANGTLAEAGKRTAKGAASAATLTGIVTFVDASPAAPAYTVSKRGASVLVRVRPDPTGAAPALPQLGAYATVEVEIEKLQAAVAPPVAPPAEPAPAPPACTPDPAQPPQVPAALGLLWQVEIKADGAPFASSDVAGVVMAACPEEGKLLISADDLRESGRDVLVSVPSSIEMAKLEPGDSVIATAAIEAGGTLTLTGLASDERSKGADDVAATQGDLVPRKAE